VTFNDVNDTSSTEKFILRALVISLVLHLLIFSLWRVGLAQGWWRNMAVPRWMQWMAQAMLPVVPKKTLVEIPSKSELTFVEVDPALATPAPPKKPLFQGAQNTVAANREIKELSVMPNIDGNQEKFLKTTENAKPKLQPAPAITPPPQPAPPQHATRQSYTPGDLTMARPSDKPQEGKKDADTADQTQPQTLPQPVHHRPLTLAEAQVRNGSIGPKTHYAGGVPNVTTDVSLDVQGTPLGDYLGLMVETVKAHWYQLLETQATETTGKVVLHFRLHPDGRISDMKMVQNEVSDLLGMTCQRAVLDPKFPKWTREMRLNLPNDFYDMTFTFYYEP
jgi:hypothetical protein